MDLKKLHIKLCKKLGILSQYELIPILRDLTKLEELNSKDIDDIITYIDTFAGMQHLLNKKVCKQVGIDPVDIRTKKELAKKKRDDIAYG